MLLIIFVSEYKNKTVQNDGAEKPFGFCVGDVLCLRAQPAFGISRKQAKADKGEEGHLRMCPSSPLNPSTPQTPKRGIAMPHLDSPGEENESTVFFFKLFQDGSAKKAPV